MTPRLVPIEPESKSDRQEWFQRRVAAAKADLAYHRELLVIAMKELEAANSDIVCYQGRQRRLRTVGPMFKAFVVRTLLMKAKKQQAAKINKAYRRRRFDAMKARYHAVLEEAHREDHDNSVQAKLEPCHESRSPTPGPSVGPEQDLAGLITPEATASPKAQSPVGTPMGNDQDEELEASNPAHGILSPYKPTWKAQQSPAIPEPVHVPPSPVEAPNADKEDREKEDRTQLVENHTPVAEKPASQDPDLLVSDPEPNPQKEQETIAKEPSPAPYLEEELEKEPEVEESAEPAPDVPIVANPNLPMDMPINPAIEKVIADVPRPAETFLLAPLVRQGFSRITISKIIGGSPQGTWPSPMAGKQFPYMLKGCDHYICIKPDLNNWLPPLPGSAGALALFRDDGGSKAAHGKVYPLFICRGTHDWVYFGHYRTLNFPTTNGEVPVDRFRQFSARQKRKWCQHILEQKWGREHLLSKGVITAAQAKLPYKELIKGFPPAALLPLFERPETRNPLRLQLRLLEPVKFDRLLYDMLMDQSRVVPVPPPPIIPQRRPLLN
jgi:hypothetical protein